MTKAGDEFECIWCDEKEIAEWGGQHECLRCQVAWEHSGEESLDDDL